MMLGLSSMMSCPEGLRGAVALGGWPLLLAIGFVLCIGILVGAMLAGR